jgi:8-oxo-dGTP pyrophosphatase MutT (NUDIX family)
MTLSDYVASIRARIGHDLLLLPSVALLPRDDEDRVLLVKHSYTGMWGTIGGAIEPGERPEDAARRETKEEIGVDVALGPLIGVFGGPDYEITYPNGDRAAFVIAVYDARIEAGNPTPDNDEVTDLGWFATTAIADLETTTLSGALFSDLGYA